MKSLSCYAAQDGLLDHQTIQKMPPKITNNNNSTLLCQNHLLSQYTADSDISKITIIQSRFRVYSFQMRYSQIKIKQKTEEDYFISTLIMQYTTVATKQAESSLGYLIKPLSIKYTPKYEYGLILNTKLFVIESIIPSFYVGSVNVTNQRHGYGTLYYKNGSKYEGHWQYNTFMGYNRFIDEEGTLYQGYYSNWYLNNNGIKRNLEGSQYSGNFINNVKEGKGKEITSDTIYQGEFHNDQYHGTGVLRNLRENWEYQGQFANNRFEGIGIMISNNGKKSQGEFMKGKMIKNLSLSSLLTSTIESEKDQIKITMTSENNTERIIIFPLSSRHRKHFSSQT